MHVTILVNIIIVTLINEQMSIILGQKPTTRQPNFVLFLADDFGYGNLSSYGHPSQEAGGADAMANEGMKFTQMYSAASYCTPSRAALLTGIV